MCVDGPSDLLWVLVMLMPRWHSEVDRSWYSGMTTANARSLTVPGKERALDGVSDDDVWSDLWTAVPMPYTATYHQKTAILYAYYFTLFVVRSSVKVVVKCRSNSKYRILSNCYPRIISSRLSCFFLYQGVGFVLTACFSLQIFTPKKQGCFAPFSAFLSLLFA